MPIVTSGSATLPNHVSPRGLPPKSRPTILPGSHTNSSSRMGTIKEGKTNSVKVKLINIQFFSYIPDI